jgi:hypothetical protein
VIGEKGRAQLIRDQRDHIAAVIQDVGKVRITFSQVQLTSWTLHPGVAEQRIRKTTSYCSAQRSTPAGAIDCQQIRAPATTTLVELLACEGLDRSF